MGGMPEYNLFMVCKKPNEEAFSQLPKGFYFDLCRREELGIWMAFPFDSQQQAREYRGFMERYYRDVYSGAEALFFQNCLFVRNRRGAPVATAFLWRAYRRIHTLHWLKVKKEYEGRGIGRALLSRLLRGPGDEDCPVYLHTQPESCRAIKLYTDFGFQLVQDSWVGTWKNDLAESLPILKKLMPAAAYDRLQFSSAPAELHEAVFSSRVREF